MSQRIVKVPFDELMDLIEGYVIDLGFVREDKEFLLYADLGLSVDEEGFTELSLEIQDAIEFTPTNTTNNIINLNKDIA